MKKDNKNEHSLREMWDTIQCTNLGIIGVPEEEEKGKGTEKKKYLRKQCLKTS